jgi:type IV secretory pathway VirJ component
MKRLIFGIFILLSLPIHAFSTSEEFLSFGRFGKVTLYWESQHPSHVALFVSGEGGWNKGIIDMARALASLDAVVVGGGHHFRGDYEAIAETILREVK